MELSGWKLGQLLGSGSFGEVRLGVEKATGRRGAVKAIERSSAQSIQDVERISREFYILTSLDHKNVIRLYEVLQSDTHLYLVMEYAGGGSLDTFLEKMGGKCESEKAARKVFTQILSAIKYCHRKHIIHRDLKPENILVCTNGQIKVADFGLSNTVQYGMRARSPVGTPLYAAPEVLFPQAYPDLDKVVATGKLEPTKPDGRRSRADSGTAGGGAGFDVPPSAHAHAHAHTNAFSVLPALGPLDSGASGEEGEAAGAAGGGGGDGLPPDDVDDLLNPTSSQSLPDPNAVRAQYSPGVADVWSLGCILHRLVFGVLPYPATTIRELRGAIFNTTWSPPGPCSPALASLLRGMLEKDPLARMTAEAVSAHPWTEAGGRGSLPSLMLEEVATQAAGSLGLATGPEAGGGAGGDGSAVTAADLRLSPASGASSAQPGQGSGLGSAGPSSTNLSEAAGLGAGAGAGAGSTPDVPGGQEDATGMGVGGGLHPHFTGLRLALNTELLHGEAGARGLVSTDSFLLPQVVAGPPSAHSVPSAGGGGGGGGGPAVAHVTSPAGKVGLGLGPMSPPGQQATPHGAHAGQGGGSLAHPATSPNGPPNGGAVAFTTGQAAGGMGLGLTAATPAGRAGGPHAFSYPASATPQGHSQTLHGHPTSLHSAAPHTSTYAATRRASITAMRVEEAPSAAGTPAPDREGEDGAGGSGGGTLSHAPSVLSFGSQGSNGTAGGGGTGLAMPMTMPAGAAVSYLRMKGATPAAARRGSLLGAAPLAGTLAGGGGGGDGGSTPGPYNRTRRASLSRTGVDGEDQGGSMVLPPLSGGGAQAGALPPVQSRRASGGSVTSAALTAHLLSPTQPGSGGGAAARLAEAEAEAAVHEGGVGAGLGEGSQHVTAAQVAAAARQALHPSTNRADGAEAQAALASLLSPNQAGAGGHAAGRRASLVRGKLAPLAPLTGAHGQAAGHAGAAGEPGATGAGAGASRGGNGATCHPTSAEKANSNGSGGAPVPFSLTPLVAGESYSSWSGSGLYGQGPGQESGAGTPLPMPSPPQAAAAGGAGGVLTLLGRKAQPAVPAAGASALPALAGQPAGVGGAAAGTAAAVPSYARPTAAARRKSIPGLQ